MTGSKRVRKNELIFTNYIRDVLRLADLPISYAPILLALLRERNEDGEIVTSLEVKERIAKEVEFSTLTMNNILGDLMAAKLFTRKKRGLYQANPVFFWGTTEEDRIADLKLIRHYPQAEGEKEYVARFTEE